jgi:hypothetical protein
MGVNQGSKGGFKVGTLWADALRLGGTLLSFTVAQFNQIMAAFGTVSFDRGVKVAKVALTATTATTGGAVAAWANPEAGAIIIVRALIDITTVSTGAAALDIGTTATNATTSSDTLLDGVDVNAATGVFDNVTDKGTNGKARQRLASGKWVTVTGSASTVGMVGSMYIFYVNA